MAHWSFCLFCCLFVNHSTGVRRCYLSLQVAQSFMLHRPQGQKAVWPTALPYQVALPADCSPGDLLEVLEFAQVGPSVCYNCLCHQSVPSVCADCLCHLSVLTVCADCVCHLSVLTAVPSFCAVCLCRLSVPSMLTRCSNAMYGWCCLSVLLCFPCCGPLVDPLVSRRLLQRCQILNAKPLALQTTNWACCELRQVPHCRGRQTKTDANTMHMYLPFWSLGLIQCMLMLMHTRLSTNLVTGVQSSFVTGWNPRSRSGS